jgi:hypothetical protein
VNYIDKIVRPVEHVFVITLFFMMLLCTQPKGMSSKTALKPILKLEAGAGALLIRNINLPTLKKDN